MPLTNKRKVMKNSRIRYLAALLGIFIVIALSIGCANATPSPTAAPVPTKSTNPAPVATKAEAAPAKAPAAAPANPTKVRIVLMKGTQLFPIMVMEQQGFDKKHGIVLDKKMVASSEGIHLASRANETDVALTGWTETVKLRAEGAKVINTYPLSSFVNAVMVKNDSPMKKLEDIKGKKFGSFYNPGSITSGILRVAGVTYYGFDPYTTTEEREGAKPLLFGMLDRGDLDVIYLGEPDISSALASGKYRTIATIKEIYQTKANGAAVPLQLVTQFQEGFAEKNPEAVKGFNAALQDSIAYMKSNNAIWADLAKEVGIEDPNAVDLLRQSLSDTYYGKGWDQKMIEDSVQFGKALAKVVGPDVLPDGNYAETFTMKYLP